MSAERPTFDFTDHYAQISGLELTEEQLEELGERHAVIFGVKEEAPKEEKEETPEEKELQFVQQLDDH